MLYTLGLVPSSIKDSDSESFRTLWDKAQSEAIKNQLAATSIEIKNELAKAEEPVHITIEKINVDTMISNPHTTDLKTLDDYLLQGAVHFPGSGLLGVGNMFLFAHSTGYVVVKNQAFKAFNGLKNLVPGDTIKVSSATRVYIYKVNNVRLVDDSQALVQFDYNRNMLTLSTCNSFGAKTERYVVEADYVPE